MYINPCLSSAHILYAFKYMLCVLWLLNTFVSRSLTRYSRSRLRDLSLGYHSTRSRLRSRYSRPDCATAPTTPAMSITSHETRRSKQTTHSVMHYYYSRPNSICLYYLCPDFRSSWFQAVKGVLKGGDENLAPIICRYLWRLMREIAVTSVSMALANSPASSHQDIIFI